MELDVSVFLDRTITVANRLSARESGTGADQWWPAVLSPASWSGSAARSVSTDGATADRAAVRVQIPATTGAYLERAEWVAAALAQEVPEGGFTLALGDTLVLGELGAEGPLTRQELLTAAAGMERVEVSAFKDCRGNGAVSGSGPVGKYLAVVYAEGS